MADVDELTKDEAAIWKKLRWHLGELRNLHDRGECRLSLHGTNHLFELEKAFDVISREAEQRREAKRAASIEGVQVCKFCLKKALPGKSICAQCDLQYLQHWIDNRIGWWQWWKNLWSVAGRMNNAISSYQRNWEKCRARSK